MKNARLFTSNRIPCALSNLTPYLRRGSDLTELTDAIEDAVTAEDAQAALDRILPFARFSIYRTTDSYVRFKRTDFCGNVEYLQMNF